MTAPLAGIRVIDATTRWGDLAGRILAELGAEVVKVEPPDGCDSRGVGPFAGDESMYWACVGAGKHSVMTADVETLLPDADVFIESGCRGDFGDAFPQLVHVSVTPFGLTGPLAGAPAAEVTVEAAGGLIDLQGDADRPPLPMGAMPQAAFHAGAQAAADTVIALFERDRSGRGQHLDVSAQACVVWTLMNATGFPPNAGGNPPSSGEFRGRPASAPVQRLRLPGIVPCRDGLVQVRFQMRILGERSFDALLRWVESEGGPVPDAVRGMDLSGWLWQMRRDELDLDAAQAAADLIVDLLAKKTKSQIQAYAAEHGLTVAAIHTVADLLADPHLADRDFWIRSGDRVHAGPFARMSRTPLSRNRKVPALGSARPPPPRRKPTFGTDAPPSPFTGLKVADFSWVGVGPMIGKALADHGATVVRIESPGRLDLLRTVPPFKDGVPGPDRAQFMANFNTSKLGMTLDLKNAEGRALARRMIDWADVVLESYSPGTMARFGLDWATVSEDRDDLVMLSTSMRGQTGRERKYSGFGGQGSAIAGLFALVGWPDRPPTGPWGAYTDFVTPRFGVAALVAALLHRRRTGLGQHIDLSQIECGIRFLEPLILDYAATGRVATRLGQGSPSLDPHGVFACRGDNRYLAIGVETAAERAALDRVLDGEELGAWCGERDAFDAATRLRDAGVAAYPVLRPSDLYGDPQLTRRRFFVTLDHPVMGPTPYDGPATIYSRTPQRLRSAAPCLGEHNDRVLRELLGMAPAEIEFARTSGALGGRP